MSSGLGINAAGCQTEHPVEEVANDLRNLRAVRPQPKAAGVEEVNLGARDVALERFGTRGQEEQVILSPHRQDRPLVISAALQCWIKTVTRPGMTCRRRADANYQGRPSCRAMS